MQRQLKEETGDMQGSKVYIAQLDAKIECGTEKVDGLKCVTLGVGGGGWWFSLFGNPLIT